jgi:hypothetical protein
LNYAIQERKLVVYGYCIFGNWLYSGEIGVGSGRTVTRDFKSRVTVRFQIPGNGTVSNPG